MKEKEQKTKPTNASIEEKSAKANSPFSKDRMSNKERSRLIAEAAIRNLKNPALRGKSI